MTSTIALQACKHNGIVGFAPTSSVEASVGTEDSIGS